MKLRLEDFKVNNLKAGPIYTYEYGEDDDNVVEFYEKPNKPGNYTIAWHNKVIDTTQWEGFKASDISGVVDYIAKEVERVRQVERETLKLNKIYNQNCLDTMDKMPDNFVDLVVTSPPYDGLRDYNYYSFDFVETVDGLSRVVKEGGVVVWVVGDQVVKGDKTGTSFNQALGFKEIGFNLFDVIIYQKDSGIPNQSRYTNVFEYMFVFSKGKPKTINLLKVKTTSISYGGSRRQADGSFKKRQNKPVNPTTPRTNIWRYPTGWQKTSKDKISFEHPATFPEQLASDHIRSWSREGDLVYDPFMGSGTTAKMAHLLKRDWIGSEISEKYCQVAKERLEPYLKQRSLL